MWGVCGTGLRIAGKCKHLSKPLFQPDAGNQEKYGDIPYSTACAIVPLVSTAKHDVSGYSFIQKTECFQ